MSEQEVYVEIVFFDTGEVFERKGPFSKWRADKIDDGININLNHEDFYTRQVPAPALSKDTKG